MHAEIAATVAREHTPGLSSAACSHLEEALGRSPTVLELEVYAALLRVRAGDAEAARSPRLALTAGGAAVLAVARGRDAVVASALELAAGGARPLVVARESSAAGESEAPAERGDSLPVTVIPSPSAVPGLALAVGVLAAPADPPRPPAPGDAVVYLGVPTGREGGLAAGAAYLSPTRASQDRLLELLLALHRQPGLVLAARLLGRGGLAQAASGWGLGVQLQLDAIPRHPPSLHPNELLLAETAPRALLIAPADRLTEVLAAAQSLAVAAATIGQLTADRRLRALLKPPGAGAPRLVCELPLDELLRSARLARSTDPRACALRTEPVASPEHAPAPRIQPASDPTDRTDALPAELRNSASGPTGLADTLLAQLQTLADEPAALVLGAGPPALALAIRHLAPTGASASAGESGQVAAARQALSSAVGSVLASGATATGAAWLLGEAAEPLVPRLGAGSELAVACAELGLAVEWTRSGAAPTDGLLVVVGERPAENPGASGRFPGPGLLVAVLGFADGDPAHEHTTGELCGELVRAGLCAAVRPIGPGGLLLALGRSCAQAEGGVGCTAVLPPPGSDAATSALESAAPGRYLLAIPAHRQADARILASERGVPLWPLGRTGGSELVVRQSDGAASTFTEVLRLPVTALQAALPRP